MSEDETNIANFLCDHRAIGILNFRIGTYSIGSQDYRGTVANALRNGRIRVNRRFSDIGYAGVGASYMADNNTLSLKASFDLNALASRALLVHELTHAVVDSWNAGPIPTPVSEALAYMAEAMFCLHAGIPILLSPETGRPHPIRAAAEVGARALLGGSSREVAPAHAAALISAIQQSGHYSPTDFFKSDGLG